MIEIYRVPRMEEVTNEEEEEPDVMHGITITIITISSSLCILSWLISQEERRNEI